MGILILLILIAVIIIVVLVSTFQIVPQASARIVERLGTYNRTIGAGFHIIVPFIDRTANAVSLKEKVADFAPQPVITKDNVTMQIDTVIYFQITDPKMYTYGVERPMKAIENLTATTLRNIIGELELDETLTSRDVINTKMRIILDEATDPWGIKVNRVEVKNIIPPKDIQDAMEKQMRAEREKRESILRAEGQKMASIAQAEGEREAMIARAEGFKQSKIKEAQGKAEAIRLMYEAEATGINYIQNAKPGQQYLTLKGYDALEKLANGQSTKLIVPSNLQDISGTLASLTEVIRTTKKES